MTQVRPAGAPRLGPPEGPFLTTLEQYSALVGTIYEQAGQPERWPGLLQALTDFVGGRVGQLAVFSLDRRRRPLWAVSGFERDAYRTFVYRHATEDPRLTYILANPGRVICGEAGIDARRFHDSALYREVVAPFDIEHSLVSFFAREADRLATFAAMRGRAAGPFGAEEMDRLRLIVPHLQRAFEYYALLDDARSRADTVAAALDIVDAGVFLTDPTLQVLHVNRIADDLVREADGVRIVAGRLACRDAGASRRLTAAAASAVAAANGVEKVRHANHIEVPRGDDDLPLRLSIHPLSRRDGRIADDVSADLAVVVRRPGGGVNGAAERLKDIFGLTAAEAALASALAEGTALSAHARNRSVAISTIRTQLRALFTKTGTRRQAELVARLRENLDITLS